MNYCLIDESDPNDFLECEGEVLSAFFNSSELFGTGKNLELIRENKQIEESIKSKRNKYYNIFQFSAHGNYFKGTKNKLDYTTIVQRRGNKEDVEIFRPDSIVRTGLQADLFFSTNCKTFNSHFIDIIKNYGGISNFIAPANSSSIGNTLIFAMMFYNLLFRQVRSNALKISEENIIESFKIASCSYKRYGTKDDFRLYSTKYNKVFK
jgi:hypothetical protein